jgi:hypothetical protein
MSGKCWDDGVRELGDGRYDLMDCDGVQLLCYRSTRLPWTPVAKVTKTEHAGAKNGGGGYWGPRAAAKAWSNQARRAGDRHEVQQQADDRDDERT